MACQANLDDAKFWFGQSMYFAWAWPQLRWVSKERKPWGQIVLLCPATSCSDRLSQRNQLQVCYMCSSSFFFAFNITTNILNMCHQVKLIWMTHIKLRMLSKRMKMLKKFHPKSFFSACPLKKDSIMSFSTKYQILYLFLRQELWK